jgi:hypothetical protein
VETSERHEGFIGRCLGLAVAVAAALALAVPAHAQLGDRIHINGYSSFEWEYQVSNHEQGKGDKNGSFDADLFDLVINVQATDRLRVSADVTWEHGPFTEDGRGNVGIEYGFTEYTLHDAFKLRAGKMLVPFGIYNEIHTAKPAFIIVDEPYATNKPERLGAPARFYARWGAGLEATGGFAVKGTSIDYTLLVFNGENTNPSINPFEEDDNGAKAVCARVRVEPHPTLKFSASYYQDIRTVYDAAGEETTDRVTQTAYGASVDWTPGEFGVEVEWVGGQIPAGGTTRVLANGFAAVLYRRFGTHFTPFLEAQYLDPNDKLSDDVAGILSAGLNVRVNQYLQLKAQLDHYYTENANPRFKGQDFTQVAAAVVAGF